MPKGTLFLRYTGGYELKPNAMSEGWVDMYIQWGVSFTETSLSAIVTPAPNKEAVENKSRLQNGKRVIRNSAYVKKDERDVNVEMHIAATDEQDFWDKYDRFCDNVLDYGFLDIKIINRPNKVFRFTYLNCAQFSEFMEQLAKFTLRLNEPDPTNRGLNDKWEDEV